MFRKARGRFSPDESRRRGHACNFKTATLAVHQQYGVLTPNASGSKKSWRNPKIKAFSLRIRRFVAEGTNLIPSFQ